MPTIYELRELEDELFIRAIRKETVGRRLLSGPIVGASSALFVGYYFFPHTWLPALLLLGLIIGLVAMLGEKKASLRVTKLEFRCSGRFRGEPRFERVICTPDVNWLEYQQESEGGSDFAHIPSGLYASVGNGSSCFLPYVDEKQSHEIIAKIETKFPHLADQWRKNSPYDRNFTTMRLTPPT